jgi:hypothetical protein
MKHPAYERSQVLWLLWILIPATVAAPLSARLAHAGTSGAGIALVAIALHLGVLLVFGRFTVAVDEQTLEWRFGLLGVPRWRLALAEVSAVEVTRSRWFEGWGIRRTSEGMLYNIAGFGAVRLHCKNGRRLRLGSDEPERLAAFIRRRLATH